MLDRLLAMLESGQDSAMLRFSLGNEYVKRDRHTDAVNHYQSAVEQQPDYSAAWQALGRAHAELGQVDEAMSAFQKGIRVAEEQGDKQAAKMMGVFLRRIEKQSAQKPSQR
jgi:predicted Zn-dependent protease